MRHLRIPGKNIRNLSSFKPQVGGLLRDVNSLEREERINPTSYLHRSIINEPSTSTASTSGAETYEEPPRRTKRVRTNVLKNNNDDSKREKSVSKSPKQKKCSVPRTRKQRLRKLLFNCKECGSTEKNRRCMLKHLNTHVDAPLSCRKCRRAFNGSVAFNWHLTYYCKLKVSSQKCRFKCSQCPKEFISKSHYDGHMQGHNRNNCSYCDKVLTKRGQLIKHLLEVHYIKLERNTNKCSFCEKRYIKKNSLYYHLQQHVPDKFVCLECGEISNTFDEHIEHKKQHGEKEKFKCSKCGQMFVKSRQYLDHLGRHNTYSCITCNETFASRAKVTLHKRNGHEVRGLEPRFICPYCPVAFHTQDRFNVHMRRHSEGDRRSICCKYCKKTFKSPYTYFKHCLTINHEKFSPGVHDVECAVCGKRFRKRHELTQHSSRVHKTKRRQLYKCQHCSNYKTYSKYRMDRHAALHLRTANRFTCEYCGKTCDNIFSLKSHISYNHVKEKQFSCEICSVSFKRNSELLRHKNIHSDERPHVCSICGKSYKRFNHLTRHEKLAHKIVKGTRLVERVGALSSSDDVETKVELPQENLNATTSLLDYPECGDAATGEVNCYIVDQLVSSFVPEKDWDMDMENVDFYHVYNDVALDYTNAQLCDIQGADVIFENSGS